MTNENQLSMIKQMRKINEQDSDNDEEADTILNQFQKISLTQQFILDHIVSPLF